jgi:hypothetical protein
MSSTSPILDQPNSIDYDLLPAGPINRLANQELFCMVDAASDAYEVTWPWSGAIYARSIRLTISDWQEGELAPLVVRFFPGHQETIAGTEGMIVTKRLITPWKSPDDRALIWLLECQAEGDRLLKLEIEIDWGEALDQRIVDGLLVAQRNPEPARGIYQQSNAESTRVFGNPHGHPDESDLQDPQRARLVYHVLVNGIVEVPLLLTLSDVGEQVAWSGFLAQRDVEPVFNASAEAWERLVRAGRLWTPDVEFNRAVHLGKLAAIHHVQRTRTGWAPSDRHMPAIPALVRAWDAIDPTISRNLLAHVGRVAEQSVGRLPTWLPARPKEAPTAVTSEALVVNHASYLRAMRHHWMDHGDLAWHKEQQPAVQLCVESLIRLRWEDPEVARLATVETLLAAALHDAMDLAAAAGDEVNATRWESEVRALAGSGVPLHVGEAEDTAWSHVVTAARRQAVERQPWIYAPAAEGIDLAGAAVWSGCGLHWRAGELWVEPAWPGTWTWWALLSLPLIGDKYLSLLWDGQTMHATQPVRCVHPVQLHKRIQIRHADEFDFDPVFELTTDSDSGNTSAKHRFRPVFRFQ